MTAEHAAAAGGEVEAVIPGSRWVEDVTKLAEIIHEVIGSDCPDNGAGNAGCFDSADAILTSGWLADDRAATRQATADTILAAARRLCCGDNPAPHHAATDAHSQRMAFAEELARAVRGS